jgi:hypothetical protein
MGWFSRKDKKPAKPGPNASEARAPWEEDPDEVATVRDLPSVDAAARAAGVRLANEPLSDGLPDLEFAPTVGGPARDLGGNDPWSAARQDVDESKLPSTVTGAYRQLSLADDGEQREWSSDESRSFWSMPAVPGPDETEGD